MPKSIWGSIKLLWRAIATRQGATGIGLAVVGVFRLERLITWIVGDYPDLVAVLNPWVNYVLVFAGGILVHRAIQTEIKASERLDLIPVLELRDLATKQGWDFYSETSLECFDLAAALHQSALLCEIALYGRTGNRDHPEIWGPLNQIPDHHLQTMRITPVPLVGKDNADTDVRAANSNLVYFDLHVDRGPATAWLKNSAIKRRGKRRILEDQQEAKRATNRALIEQQKKEQAKLAEQEDDWFTSEESKS